MAVLPLPEGKLLAVTRLSGRPGGFAVVRLTDRGDLDVGTGFGDRQQGFVEVSFPDAHISLVFGFSPLKDGGSLFTGQYHGSSSGSVGLVIVRLLPDGRLNEGFGQGGAIFLDELDISTPEQVRKLKIEVARRVVGKNAEAGLQASGNSGMSGIEQRDGKIILISTGADYSTEQLKSVVIRLNPDGTFDTSFNGSGVAVVQLPDIPDNYGRGIATQDDGKIVAYGEYYSDSTAGYFVARFDIDGARDKQFLTLMLSGPESRPLMISDIAVREKDGLIALVGGVHEDMQTGVGVIVVLNRDGAFNSVFNQGKPMYSKLLYMGQQWRRCAFGGDGDSKLIIAGTSGSEYLTDYTFAITARYLLTGKLDPAFNSQGWVVFDDREYLDHATDMTITAAGRIVVCGEHYKTRQSTSPQSGWITRYLA
jgi:uncharacterized delta-60 repeat protein